MHDGDDDGGDRLFDHADPVMGTVQHVSGLIALFFINLFLFAGIIIWVISLAILAFTNIKKERPHLMKRYCVLLVPSVFVILSIILGLFFGTFGPIQREAPGFVYFFTMYNLYVWVLLVAYWPMQSSLPSSYGGSSSEATPIKSHQEFGPTSDTIFGEDDTL